MTARRQTRMLIVRPDHLGDVLLTLPAVTSLRELMPDAQITVATACASVDAARLCRDIDAVIGVPFPSLHCALDETSWPAAAAAEGARLRGLFDIAILPRPDDPWSGILVAAADVPVRLGYNVARTRPFLTHTVPAPGREHVVTTAIRAINAASMLLGFGHVNEPKQGQSTSLLITPEHESEVEQLLDQLGVNATVVLHPAAGWSLKHWPAERWGALATALRRQHGIRPLVTGAPNDRTLASAVVAASSGSALDVSGRTSLGGLAALYRRAELVVAIDSGPMHLAALVGTQVVGLYGPADPIQFAPWVTPHACRIVRVQLPCSPCGNLLDPPCGARHNPACMHGISVDSVLDAVQSVWTQGTSSH